MTILRIRRSFYVIDRQERVLAGSFTSYRKAAAARRELRAH